MTNVYSPTILKLHSTLKCLSKCHIVIGLILLILSIVADYVSHRMNTVRMHGLAECCSFYFILTGFLFLDGILTVTGIFGSASHRRGLIIAFMIMTIHACTIFAPIVIIASSFDIHFYRRKCWGECDWHLLSASIPNNSMCRIMCGDNIDNNLKNLMTRLGTDYRIDAGLISLAVLEFILSIFTCIFCCKQIFGLQNGKREFTENASTLNLELQLLNHQNSLTEESK